MIAPSARWSVWVQPASWVRTCSPPTIDLDREEERRAHGQPDDRRPVALGPPRHDRDDRDDEADQRRDPAVEDMRGRQLGEGREEGPAHQRPVREDQRGIRRGDLRPEEQQRERGRRRECREQREPLAAAADREVGRETGTHGQVDEQPDEQERRREMRGDRLPAVAEADRLATEPRLEADQADRRERGPDDRRPVAMTQQREPGQRQDLDADDRRDRAVGPLDPRLRVVERREQLAVAERPVRAAQPRNRWPARPPRW